MCTCLNVFTCVCMFFFFWGGGGSTKSLCVGWCKHIFVRLCMLKQVWCVWCVCVCVCVCVLVCVCVCRHVCGY